MGRVHVFRTAGLLDEEIDLSVVGEGHRVVEQQCVPAVDSRSDLGALGQLGPGVLVVGERLGLGPRGGGRSPAAVAGHLKPEIMTSADVALTRMANDELACASSVEFVG